MIRITLHPIRDDGNRYCGPAVLSALTGLTTTECSAILRKVGGRSSIKGTYQHEMFESLHRLGYRETRLPITRDTAGHYPSLASWLKRFRSSANGGVHLICPGHHWAIITPRFYHDNATTKPVAHREAPRRRARIRAVWLLERVHSIDPGTLVPVRPATTPAGKAEAKSRCAARKELHAIAKLHGLDIDDRWRDERTVWVYPPDWITEGDLDPRADEHYCDSWEEAVQYAREIVTAIEANSHRKAALEAAVARIDEPEQ